MEAGIFQFPIPLSLSHLSHHHLSLIPRISSSSPRSVTVKFSSANSQGNNYIGQKPRREWVADWVAQNDDFIRSLPIYVGGLSLLAVLFNRAVSGIAPVADASRETESIWRQSNALKANARFVQKRGWSQRMEELADDIEHHLHTRLVRVVNIYLRVVWITLYGVYISKYFPNHVIAIIKYKKELNEILRKLTSLEPSPLAPHPSCPRPIHRANSCIPRFLTFPSFV